MQTLLSTEAAAAICRHMNDDHGDAVAGYARTFAQIASVAAAQITALDAHGMDLAVDTGAEQLTTRIAFDHPLADSDDARRTLIAMAQASEPT